MKRREGDDGRRWGGTAGESEEAVACFRGSVGTGMLRASAYFRNFRHSSNVILEYRRICQETLFDGRVTRGRNDVRFYRTFLDTRGKGNALLNLPLLP